MTESPMAEENVPDVSGFDDILGEEDVALEVTDAPQEKGKPETVPPSGMQINATNEAPKNAEIDYGENAPLKADSTSPYLEELGQIDTLITKLIVDGRRDTERKPHRAEAIRCLKMAMPSLARI